MNKEIIFTTISGFVTLSKQYESKFILRNHHAVTAVSDGAYVVVSAAQIVNSVFREVIKELKEKVVHRYYSTNFDPSTGNASFVITSKVDLVRVLKILGVDDTMVSKIKSVKASELRELIDRSPTKEDNSQEISEVVMRLTKKNDKIEFDTNIVGLSTVTITLDTSHSVGAASYILSGNVKEHVVKLIDDACEETGLPIFIGQPANVNVNNNFFDGTEI